MSDDDRLIRALGEMKREEDLAETEDERWDALARGELTDDEIAALQAERDADVETEARLAAFAPFDAAELDRLADGARDALQAPIAPEAAPPVIDELAKRRRPRSHLVMALAAALAVAAGVFFFLRAPAADLPVYALAVAGGDQAMRSTGAGAAPRPASGPLPLARGSTLDLVARPDRKVETPIEARAFFVQGGKLTPITVALPRSSDGAFRLRAAREVLFPGAVDGPATVLIALGAPDDLPATPSTPSDLEGGRRQVLRQEVELTP